LTVRAYRAVFGVDAVLFAGETPIAWRIAGGYWNFRPDEAANVVERFGHEPVEVPAWATAPDSAGWKASVGD
jgi:hypothetical protein